MALILGIETSCDETAAALYESNKRIIASTVYSQIELHKAYGGVVPEVASRAHVQKIAIIIQTTLEQAGISLDNVDAVAVTNKPGLPGSLLVGTCFAKAIAWACRKKLIGINHLEGHIFSSCIENSVPFPHLCLAASGGHTSLYYVKGFGTYECIASTMDDAAGEAFDKVAKLINIPYPGGPILEVLAREVDFKDFFKYPRGHGTTLNFSFSGLKTAVMYDLVKRNAYDMHTKKLIITDPYLQKQVASSLTVCIADIFASKIAQALDIYTDTQAVTFVGGVACNAYITSVLSSLCHQYSLSLIVPRKSYCTDNAAMIAFVGHYKYASGNFDSLTLDIV